MNDPAQAEAEHPALKYFRTVAALDALRMPFVFIQWIWFTSRLEEMPVLRLFERLILFEVILLSALAWGTYRLKNWARVAQFVAYPWRVIVVASILSGGGSLPLKLLSLSMVPHLVLVPLWFRLSRCGALFGRPEAEKPAGAAAPPLDTGAAPKP